MTWNGKNGRIEEDKPVVTPPRQEPVKPAPKEEGNDWKPIPPTEFKKPANLESTCPAPGVFGAVDASEHVTQRFLDAAKYLGIKTVLRYYDVPGSSTLPEKIPTAAEMALIKKNGFKFCAVYQHNNSKLASFTSERGAHDAGVALELAKKWGQPKGSTIFYGVDFDPSKAEITGPVMDYGKRFAPLVRAAGFRVGAYGSGLTLRLLLEAGLIDFAWLSMSTGFRESKEFAASGKWCLRQVKDRNCGGMNVDFDYVNPQKPDFGQWSIP